MLDVMDAVDLTEHLVSINGRDHREPPVYIDPVTHEPACIVGRALFISGATKEQLFEMSGRTLRYLYRNGPLPVEMTLGASEVFAAAQRAQDTDDGTWGDALDAAIETAERFIGILPFTAVPDLEPEKTLVSA